jgi:5'-deoxynucleotidase YfbR-like HD superfamily hydrolase
MGYEKMVQRIETLMDSGRVKRLHTVPTNGENTVGHHVYGTLMLAVEILAANRDKEGLDGGRVLHSLMFHDAAELFTGDVPAPVKLMDPVLGARLEELELKWDTAQGLHLPDTLTALEELTAKTCDTLDLAYIALYERRMGNRHPRMDAVFWNCMSYTSDAQLKLNGVYEIRNYLLEEWGEK